MCNRTFFERLSRYIKEIIFVVTFFHICVVFLFCWTEIGVCYSLEEFKEKKECVGRGVAKFISIEPRGKLIDYVYEIFDYKDSLLYTDRNGGNITGFAPENYLGCEYVCYYDLKTPADNYICYDSIIEGLEKFLYKTKGYVTNVRSTPYDYDIVTIKWYKKNAGWKYIEQAISIKERDRFLQYKNNGQQVVVSVFETGGGELAQIK